MASSVHSILSPFECESVLSTLHSSSVRDVASASWFAQHDSIERLNIQAHIGAKNRHDEYVVDLFVRLERMPLLIHELLVIEAWRSEVSKAVVNHIHILEKSSSHVASMLGIKLYMTVYHEATIMNLMEILLYHEEIAKSCNDTVVELADYCYRRVTQLNAGEFKAITDPDRYGSSDDCTEDGSSYSVDLEKKLLNCMFSVCMSSLTVIRYLTEHINNLPLGVASRLLHDHDIVVSICHLLVAQPWSRRRIKKTMNGLEQITTIVDEKFLEQQWIIVQPQDVPLVSQIEGQVWLTLYNCLTSESFRRQYQFNSVRRQSIINLKPLLTDIMLDQLPMLRDLRRMVEELSIMQPSVPAQSSMTIIEQIPELRTNILKDVKWSDIIQHALSSHFNSDSNSVQQDMKLLAKTYNIDHFDGVLDTPLCCVCGENATQRCSRCKLEWYCSRKCQVSAWKQHKSVCDLVTSDRTQKQ